VGSVGSMTNKENLAEYFAKRWFNKPSAREIRFVNEILESFFGQNGLYFVNKTDELIDMKIRYNKKISPSVLDEFKITGDAEEDGVIVHAGMIWSLLNGEPWPEAVYHDYVERLVKGGSDLAAYVAARLWPARGLLEKVQYRPLLYKIDTGNLTKEDYKDILMKFYIEYPLFNNSYLIPNFLKYRDDFNIILCKIPRYYLEKFGFSHPICALAEVCEIDNFFIEKVREILEKDDLSEEIYEALLFLHLHLEVYIKTAKESKSRVRSALLDLQANLDSFIRNRIKKCTELELKTKDLLSIEPMTFKKFINQFLALYNTLSFELYIWYFVRNIKEEFDKKIVRAILKLSEEKEEIFEKKDFISENLIKIITYMKDEEKTKIEKYIKNRLEENKIKEFLTKVELYNIFLNPDNFDNHLKKLEKILKRKEIIKIAIKDISDVHANFKIKILSKIMEKEFGELNFKKYEVEKDLYLMIGPNVYKSDFESTRKYGFILYLEMKEKYSNFYVEKSEDPYINIYKEIANKMHIAFNERNYLNIFYNIIYTLERIYFGNFINRDEEISSINLLFENIKANRGYIYKNLEKNQKLLIDIIKKFILNIEKLREYENIDEIMDILMKRKNYNMQVI